MRGGASRAVTHRHHQNFRGVPAGPSMVSRLAKRITQNWRSRGAQTYVLLTPEGHGLAVSEDSCFAERIVKEHPDWLIGCYRSGQTLAEDIAAHTAR